MSSKVLFSCDYPIYSVGRLEDGGTEFFVAGGGGKAKTGIPNSLDTHRLCVDDGGGCGSEAVLHHDTDTGVVMNSASHPIKGNQLAVGEGGECLSLEIRRKRDSPKKDSRVKRRKKSKSDEEESGVSKVVSREVVVITRAQTDFSSECYQKTVAFSCHGDRVVTGGSDGIVRVWKYPSLDKVCELKSHENEIETLSCHPSKEQAVSMCRGGKAVVWDLANEDQEHWFSWTPGQLHTRHQSEAKPAYRFRTCCFSPKEKESEGSHTSLYTLTIPMDTRSKLKRCYLVKWDAGAWIVDDEISTGTELLSALAIDTGGRYLGVGTISGSILVYSSDLKLLSKVAAVHTVFVTGLLFLPLPTKKRVSSSGKQVSKQEKLVLISVSADRTCSATLVTHKSGRFTFIFLFIFISLLLLLIAVACKHYQIW